MELLLRLLSLMSNEQLLELFEKIVRQRLVATWPPAPDDEIKKAEFQQLHGILLSAGYDRGLSQNLRESDLSVREKLKHLKDQTGGILFTSE